MDRRAAGAVWAFIAVLAAAATGLQALVTVALPDAAALDVGGSPLLWFAVLVAAFYVADRFGVHLRPGQHSIEFSMVQVPLVVGLFVLPPELLLPARLAGCLVNQVLERRPPERVSFNLAMYAVETTHALLVFHLLLGAGDPLGPRAWVAVLLAAAVASTTSSVLVSLVVGLASGRRVQRVSEIVGLGTLGDLVNSCFALIAVYVLALDWRAAWLFVVLAGTVWFAFSSFEGARRRSESLAQVNRFTELVGREVELDAVVRTVLTELRAAFRARRAHLRLAAGTMDWTLLDGVLTRGASGLVTALEGRAGGEPVLVPKRTRVPSLVALLRSADVADCMLVPLLSEGRPVGCVVVADTLDKTDSLRADDLRQLRALANHAAVAIDNAVRADALIRAAEERERRASYDELTGLANRQLLGTRTGEVLRTGGAAVVRLDIDRFAEVNDALGHEVADRLLCQVARRLEVAAHTAALVAHLGGDEFALLLPGADEPAARRAAAEVHEALSQPFELLGIRVAVTARLGVAVEPAGTDAVAVLRRAGLAMEAAKEARSEVVVFRPGMDRQDASRLGLLADLRAAVAGDLLTVSYQPKVDLRTGRVEGVEALARWRHPRHGVVAPDEFIPLAEHSSLITPLTVNVLRRALADLACFRVRAGGHLDVAVNISPRSLTDPAFVDLVAEEVGAAADRHGLDASALMLEITETSLMSDPERAVEAMRRLRLLGIRLSVDDLGTGYSSLAYLQRLPVDEVKIDRSFLTCFPDGSAQAVVGAIVDLGHRLGHRVVAEGVEDAAAYAALGRLGVDSAQGYWLGRPEPADVLGPLLADWTPRRALRVS